MLEYSSAATQMNEPAPAHNNVCITTECRPSHINSKTLYMQTI